MIHEYDIAGMFIIHFRPARENVRGGRGVIISQMPCVFSNAMCVICSNRTPGVLFRYPFFPGCREIGQLINEGRHCKKGGLGHFICSRRHFFK